MLTASLQSAAGMLVLVLVLEVVFILCLLSIRESLEFLCLLGGRWTANRWSTWCAVAVLGWARLNHAYAGVYHASHAFADAVCVLSSLR